jgi:hypothetical protein
MDLHVPWRFLLVNSVGYPFRETLSAIERDNQLSFTSEKRYLVIEVGIRVETFVTAGIQKEIS